LSARVWLSEGRVAWAECSNQRRGLAGLLRALLRVDARKMRELARDWHERKLAWSEAVLSHHIEREQLRQALHEHVRQALMFVTTSERCEYRFENQSVPGTPMPVDLTFSLEAVVSWPGAEESEAKTLEGLLQRVYGASWVEVVSGGVAAGLGPQGADEAALLESADALLFGHADDVQLCLLRSVRGSWAGFRTGVGSSACSIWIGFAPHVQLGGAFLGLQAAAPLARRSRTAPVLPALGALPSLFPAPGDAVRVRGIVSPALELGDGALAAHLFSQGAVRWGTGTRAAIEGDAFFAGLSRADSLLEMCSASRDPQQPVAEGMEDLVMLGGASGFHVGSSVPGSARTSFFLSFAPGASYGQGTAALAVGIAALRGQTLL
ncbi:MAG TPA: hypothetical protein VFZ61_05475, partial [Polyangiales bacterium]